MKLLLLFLTLAPSFAFGQAETVTVTAKKIHTQTLNPGLMVADDGPGSKSSNPGEGGGGGGGKFSAASKAADTQLIAQAMVLFGESINKLMAKDAWAELSIDVTTPDGYKVRIEIRAGYGKVEMLNKKKI